MPGIVGVVSKGCCALCAGLLVVSTGCDRYWVCDDVAPSRLDALPAKLSETGLYAVLASEALADGVQPYAPRFALWSDGADKRRWLRLPPNSQIDTTDMDAWVFPEGTQVWKEFTSAGVRVETRLLQKVGPGESDWAGLAYVWADDQSEAFAARYGAVDAAGTDHDVPAASECNACHGGTRSHVLGVSAIQLAGDAATHSEGISLRSLTQQGALSSTPSDFDLALPGSETEQAALGYLHANCSQCHNQQRPPHTGARCFDPQKKLDFQLSVDALADVQETATYRTAIDDVIKPGDPDASKLIDLISHRGLFKQMPPLATEQVDERTLALMRRWIDEL